MESKTSTLPEAQRERINLSVLHFSALPDEALIDVHTISVLLDRSVNTVWRMAKAGVIATPIKVGPKTTRWRVGSIRAYLTSLGE